MNDDLAVTAPATADAIANAETQAIAIEINDVTKSYRLVVSAANRLRAALGKIPPPAAEYRALNGVSFSIRRGESLGILGVNGAGKSTLLQIVAGTLAPTSGRATVNGRVAALLELGAGFNRDWTGRRNAEFHCMIAGVPPEEINRHLASIEEFADIGAFFDQPMRTYSSGMYMRVAFAAAIAVDPDILIVDEALAVGDARFQNKCYAHFRTLLQNGCTLLFVTHSIELVKQFCTRAILLDKGCIAFDGAATDATEHYLELLHRKHDLAQAAAPASVVTSLRPVDAVKAVPFVIGTFQDRVHFNPVAARRLGNGALEIVDFELLDESRQPAPRTIECGGQIVLRITVRAVRDVENPYIGWILKRVDETIVCGTNTQMQSVSPGRLAKGEYWSVELAFQAALSGGDYFFDLGAGSYTGEGYVAGDWRMSMGHFTVAHRTDFFGVADLKATFADLDRHISDET